MIYLCKCFRISDHENRLRRRPLKLAEIEKFAENFGENLSDDEFDDSDVDPLYALSSESGSDVDMSDELSCSGISRASDTEMTQNLSDLHSTGSDEEMLTEDTNETNTYADGRTWGPVAGLQKTGKIYPERRNKTKRSSRTSRMYSRQVFRSNRG